MMPERIKTLWLVTQHFTSENWHYVIGWALITFQWIADIPEPYVRILIAVATGFGLGLGKWCWEKFQKYFNL